MQEDIIAKIVRWMAALSLTIWAIFTGTFLFGGLEWPLIHWNYTRNDINLIITMFFPTVICGFFAWKLWKETFSSYTFSFFSAILLIYLGSSSVPGMIATLWPIFYSLRPKTGGFTLSEEVGS